MTFLGMQLCKGEARSGIVGTGRPWLLLRRYGEDPRRAEL